MFEDPTKMAATSPSGEFFIVTHNSQYCMFVCVHTALVCDTPSPSLQSRRIPYTLAQSAYLFLCSRRTTAAAHSGRQSDAIGTVPWSAPATPQQPLCRGASNRARKCAERKKRARIRTHRARALAVFAARSCVRVDLWYGSNCSHPPTTATVTSLFAPPSRVFTFIGIRRPIPYWLSAFAFHISRTFRLT